MSDTLYIVDTMYQIFKSFYGLGRNARLTSPQGVPTGAVYGLARTLKSWRHKLGMEYCICSFESPVPVFRCELSPEYKANRPPVDPDLKVQIPLAIDMCRHLGYTIVSADGYEADDVIGTLAAKALQKGWKVRVMSKDKDLAQLLALEGDIAVMMPSDGKAKDHYVDKNTCQEHYCGVPAELIVDWLALMGDTSDNIIGIKGIGEKTGAKLLNKCGSLDKLMEQPNLAGRFAAEIAASQERLRLNRCLATVCKDVALPFELENLADFAIKNPDNEAENFCNNLGINLGALN